MSVRQASFRESAEALAGLGVAVRVMRQARGLSLRQAGEQTGVGFNTIGRLEHGGDCSLSNAIALLRWLDETPQETEEDADVHTPRSETGDPT